jgi:hypothetical protein
VSGTTRQGNDPRQGYGVKTLALGFACLLVALLMAGCEPAGTMRSARLQSPNSLSDLLVNVGEITRSGLILEDDFYTEDNLKRVFGGTIADVHVAFNGFRQGAVVKGFPAWSELGNASMTPDALTLDVSRSFDLYGKPRAQIVVNSNVGTTLGFDRIERLFGKNWDVVGPMVPLHGPGTGPPPDPPASQSHRNEEIRYQLGEPRLMRTLQISLAPDATFKRARATANQY